MSRPVYTIRLGNESWPVLDSCFEIPHHNHHPFEAGIATHARARRGDDGDDTTATTMTEEKAMSLPNVGS
jgi:hypothetical protein